MKNIITWRRVQAQQIRRNKTQSNKGTLSKRAIRTRTQDSINKGSWHKNKVNQNMQHAFLCVEVGCSDGEGPQKGVFLAAHFVCWGESRTEKFQSTGSTPFNLAILIQRCPGDHCTACREIGAECCQLQRVLGGHPEQLEHLSFMVLASREEHVNLFDCTKGTLAEPDLKFHVLSNVWQGLPPITEARGIGTP